ncbi:MYBL1 [Cordylochernes scorpioides]|uniref:MYBL1 n=1 Tax=Cordylochernes scorpioides TaxID=51811 RepID=A0ABY6KRJ3_9ARAC|nr:MYBL1 [Cordylochernes scorpioides]
MKGPLSGWVAFGEEGLTYTFSGVTVPALTWDPIILTIRDLVSELVGCQFNFVLLNRYKDGTDKIGEHRDDEKDLVPKAPIASLSLGAERDFIFRHVDARQGKADIDPVTIPLTSGSLLVMRHPTNDVWYHSLPERRNVFSPRINLTFRVMVPPSATQKVPAFVIKTGSTTQWQADSAPI